MQRHLRLWLGLGTSLVFLVLVFLNKDLGAMGQALAGADYRTLLPAIVVYFAGVYFRTLRWQTLLAPLRRLSLADLFGVVAIGYMANNVLPARAGELVRAYVLGWRHTVPKSATLATVALERVFDGLTMVAFILMATSVVALNDTVRTIAAIGAALFVGLLVGLVALGALPRLQAFVHLLLTRLLPGWLAGRVEGIVFGFVGGLAALRSATAVARVVATSLAAWLCEAAMYLIVGLSFDLGIQWPVALLATAVANLFTLLPSSPGYIGIFEAGVLAVLTGLLGRPEEAALAYALVLHAALWLPITLVGMAYWWRASLGWRELTRVQTGQAPPTPGPEARP